MSIAPSTTVVMTCSSDPPLGFASRRMTSPWMHCESAADEVHDLQPVAIVQHGRGPGIAADDDLVQLDGDAVGLDAQLLHQRRQRQLAVEGSLCAIDHKFHRERL